MHLNLIYVYKLVLPFCCCVSSLLLPNKLSPKCTNLKQYMYIISHLLWARDRAWLHCVHSFQGPSWAAIKVWTGLCPFTVPVGKKSFPTSCNCFQDPVPPRQLNLRSRFLTAVGWRPCSVPCHVGLSITAAGSSTCSS